MLTAPTLPMLPAPPAQPKECSARMDPPLRSALLRPQLWAGVRARLLPLLAGVCAAAEAGAEPVAGLGAVFEARALSGKLCAFPGCLNLRGASEAAALLPQHACPGCGGEATYCSAACREADRARHAPACAAIQALRQGHGGSGAGGGEGGSSGVESLAAGMERLGVV